MVACHHETKQCFEAICSGESCCQRTLRDRWLNGKPPQAPTSEWLPGQLAMQMVCMEHEHAFDDSMHMNLIPINDRLDLSAVAVAVAVGDLRRLRPKSFLEKQR